MVARCQDADSPSPHSCSSRSQTDRASEAVDEELEDRCGALVIAAIVVPDRHFLDLGRDIASPAPQREPPAELVELDVGILLRPERAEAAIDALLPASAERERLWFRVDREQNLLLHLAGARLAGTVDDRNLVSPHSDVRHRPTPCCVII